MTLRVSLGLAFICLALVGCSDEESGSPPVTSAPASDVSTQVAAAEVRAVINDWYVDGTIDKQHRCVAIREAMKELPSRVYSKVNAEFRRANRRACG
ncbi:MAG TPA: hypothetical protein DCP25_03345 [Chloroflexi bacterium]|nr:hypothetical protein [Chloroflexota bacterium]